MPRPTTLSVDLDALLSNAATTRSLAGNRKILASVKANAYGHGLSRCSKALSQNVDGFAVAFCEEAVVLRQQGISLPLLLLEGPFDRDDVDAINEHDLMVAIHDHHQIDLLEKASYRFTSPVWIKIDTGMHRLGFSPAEASTVDQRLRQLGAHSTILMTHYAEAEHPSSALTLEQQRVWQASTSSMPPTRSAANSAAIMNALATATDWVRPGIMLYGAAHTDPLKGLPLEPVMSLTSEVMALRKILAGDTVGYGGRWRAPRDSLIATIPVGYGDGYPRGAEDGTPVWLQSQRFPLAGRVSMDMITVDVTDFQACQIGTPVELWGKHLSVNEVAKHAGTIGYELLTRLTGRVPVIYHP
ncbi:MAG: alanine racemase [Luminiphilus sp.]|nr:alanine racemase [Luminiphilus sp.]